MGSKLQGFGDVRSGRYSYQESGFNEKGEIVQIWGLLKAILECNWRPKNIMLVVEVHYVEGKGAYCRRIFEGGTDLIPPT